MLFAPIKVKSQIKYEVEAQAIGTTNGVVPFWMRSNQHGSIPLSGISLSYLGRISKDYALTNDSTGIKRKIIDWGVGFESRVNSTIKKPELLIIEGYLKAKTGTIELKAGRFPGTVGLLGDTILTTGSFSDSGNALGVPKFEISIPQYYQLPILGKIISIKGSIAHGFLGAIKINDTIENQRFSRVGNAKTYLHQKSFYAQIGKPEWRIHLIGGINHQVFWGSEKEHFGSLFKLTQLQTALYVFSGKKYIMRKRGSKIGNHLGTIDMSIKYHFKGAELQLYRQNFYDVGALYYLANLRDGLNGITFRNDKKTSRLFLKKMSAEYFYSKNQAGESWSKLTPSGDEDYYNNYLYAEGWSYKKIGIGNPLISPRLYTRNELPKNPRDYFINNRVIAIFFGGEVTYRKWDLTSKTAYSWNYGSYGTSQRGHTTGTIYPGAPSKYGIFPMVRQFSSILQISKTSRKTTLSVQLAKDFGSLYYNSNGIAIRYIQKF